MLMGRVYILLPMSQRTPKLPDISAIANLFEAQPKRIFTVTELHSLLKEHALSMQWPPGTQIPDVIKALLKTTRLQQQQLNFPSKRQKRFTWGEMPIHQILLSLNSTKAYFSHLTALHLHKLSNKNLKTIYVNCEQSPKAKNEGSLEQSAIDEAFARPARISRNSISFKSHRVYLLNGMYTDGLGVITVVLPETGTVRVTNIERTLIDIVVRPSYSGGISGVLDAFQKSKHLASVETILQMLNELEYVYPYHQAIGFYLDACGYDGATVLRKFGLNYKFYLGHQIRDPVLNEKWRVVFPKSLKVSIR